MLNIQFKRPVWGYRNDETILIHKIENCYAFFMYGSKEYKRKIKYSRRGFYYFILFANRVNVLTDNLNSKEIVF